MSRERLLLIAVIAVIALGVVAVAVLSRLDPTPATAPEAPEAAAVAAPAATPETDAEAPPPWAQAGAEAVAPDAAATAAQHDPQQEQQLRDLQASMQGLLIEATQRSAAGHAHLRQALDTLEQMDDPAVDAQLNLPAVRHNLEIGIRMQKLAQELQQIMAEPHSPQRQQRLDAKMMQFRELQSQLRTDIVPPGAAAQASAKATER